MIVLMMVFFVTGCKAHTESDPLSTGQQAGKHKVVVIVVDSLTNRSLNAAMTNPKYAALRYIVTRGHYFPQVVASFPSMSVSDISTLVTGESPEKHRIPGLVWFDATRNTMVNYGNSFRQTMALGTKAVSQNALYELNQTHLSKNVQTIFEDLQDAGYSTGAINMLVYRGRKPHQLTLPVYSRPFTGAGDYTVNGPDTLVLGELTTRSSGSKGGVFHRFGVNDDFAADAFVRLVREGKLPDFTMVYFPSNDKFVHKHGVDTMKGIAGVDTNIQKILSAYGTWDETLGRITLIVMGDGGVTPVFHRQKQPTILLKDSLRGHSLYRWGKKQEPSDDLAIAVNSRMAYTYLLNGPLRPAQVVNQLKAEKRIDLIAWPVGNSVFVTTPENHGTSFSFYKNGPLTDPYGETWGIEGKQSILDIAVSKNKTIAYGKYPDALHQLWSAAHCQPGRYIIVTAKRGYQFGDEGAPTHDGGAQQASLLAEDVYAPIIITGTRRVLKQPSRFEDLKNYFSSVVKDS